MIQDFKKAKLASRKLMCATTAQKNTALQYIAEDILSRKDEIFKANAVDVEYAKEIGLSASMVDRLVLDEKRVKAMSDGVLTIMSQEDPVGTIEKGFQRPNGLVIHKVRVPLGVVGIIYESRPNVTVDAAALCIKSGNVSILRGGKEAVHSCRVLGEIITDALMRAGLPEYSVLIVEDSDRTKIMQMLKAKNDIDIIVPRGGEGLIQFCTEHSLVPLVKHDKGLCHVYIDSTANLEMAANIAFDAKVDRPGVCNAIETLLVHQDIAADILPSLCQKYVDAGVELRGCDAAVKLFKMIPATDEDWDTEYLDLILSIKVVGTIEDAIDHINTYGSLHSEAIVTDNFNRSQQFLTGVDAAAVYVNASTRFTDGAEFGLGAEIGISTQKLHCRGPMGAYDLTTSKYQILGTGQTKS